MREINAEAAFRSLLPRHRNFWKLSRDDKDNFLKTLFKKLWWYVRRNKNVSLASSPEESQKTPEKCLASAVIRRISRNELESRYLCRKTRHPGETARSEWTEVPPCARQASPTLIQTKTSFTRTKIVEKR